MKICIAIVCTILGATACKSKKSEPSSTATEPPSKTMPTTEPSGSSAPPAGSGSATAPDPHAGHQGSGSGAATAAIGPACTEFDHAKFADKHAACVECEKHRGMGSMEADCKNAIAKPWK